MRESPDHHDVELMLRLYELRREEKLRQAREWFMREFHAETLEEFARRCPPGSEANAFFRMVTSYWEMAGSVVNHGLIKPHFFFESNGEFFFVWDRIRALAPAVRKAYKNPHYWENLEKLTTEYEKWMAERAPEALETARQRVRAAAKPSEKS